MKKMIQPIRIGNLLLENNVFYSPLAGCSDFSYRTMASIHPRPGLFFCEMVKMEALIRHDLNTFHLLDYHREMHPIGAQLCGSNPQIAGRAAKMIEDLGFDTVDLNCGCPVDKVTKDGSGSGLLKTPDLIGEIIANMVAAVKIPVTVKIRIGWDLDSINAPQITAIAEAAGAKAIAVHGRTRVQGYKGFSDRNKIRQCKEAARQIIVIGNGDVFDGESAKNLFHETGCDAILVSRGTLGKPWIAAEIIEFLQNGSTLRISLERMKKYLLEHISTIARYQNPRKALLEIRKVGCWYLKEIKGAKNLRGAINKAKTVEEAVKTIQEFPNSLQMNG